MQRYKPTRDQRILAPCDWCDEAAAWQVEVVKGSLMYARACHEHKPLLEEFEDKRPPRRRFK
jgi:hypothetical protein